MTKAKKETLNPAKGLPVAGEPDASPVAVEKEGGKPDPRYISQDASGMWQWKGKTPTLGSATHEQCERAAARAFFIHTHQGALEALIQTEDAYAALESTKPLDGAAQPVEGALGGKYRENLEERRNSLMNNFGHGAFRDGRNQEAIDKIDAELAKAHPQPAGIDAEATALLAAAHLVSDGNAEEGMRIREAYTQPAGIESEPIRIPPYRVELDTQGCKTCGHDAQWCITVPDGSMFGRTWGDREEAVWIAERLNTAFEFGCTEGVSKRLPRCISCESTLYMNPDGVCDVCRAAERGVSTL